MGNLSLQIWFFGFVSGFSLLINGSTLNFWLAYEGVNKFQIGLFSTVLLPYSINFLWMPLLESRELKILSPILGHRISWVVVIQLLLLFSTLVISMMSPMTKLYEMYIVAFIISFLGSTQNTVLCSIRTILVPNNRQGELSSKYVFGYKIGMLVAGSGSIYCSAFISWQAIYQIFSVIVFTFALIIVLMSIKLKYNKWDKLAIDQSLVNSSGICYSIIFTINKIIRPIGNLNTIFLTLLFLAIYQLPDNLISSMLHSFLLELQFKPTEIASSGRLFGSISSIIGTVLAGYIMRNGKILNYMFYFGLVHAIVHLSYISLAVYGKNLVLFTIISMAEGLTVGMLMSSYIAFISSLCKGKYRATQYAIFSSMMGMARSLFPVIAGYLVNIAGWKAFFMIITIIAIITSSCTQLLKKYLKYKVI